MRISDWSSDVCSSDLRFIFTGERTVHVDGNYAGTIVREKDGWRWMGNHRAFRTFTLAAQYVGEKYLRREEARRVRLEVPEGDAVIRRSQTNGDRQRTRLNSSH